MWVQHADDCAAAERRLRALLQKQEQLVAGRTQVVEASLQLITVLKQRLKPAEAAAAAAAQGVGDQVQQALMAAKAAGVGMLDGSKVLYCIAPTCLTSVLGNHNRLLFIDDFKEVCQLTQSVCTLSTAPEGIQNPYQFTSTMSICFGKMSNFPASKTASKQQLAYAEGTTGYTRGPDIQYSFSMSWYERTDEAGNCYMDVSSQVSWDSDSPT